MQCDEKNVSVALKRTPAYTARSRIRSQSICTARCACLLRNFCWCSLCLPRRDGQTELVWVDGYRLHWYTSLWNNNIIGR